MDNDIFPTTVLHWNYRGFTEFPLHQIEGEENEVTDIYLKENLISRIPIGIARLERLESLYLCGNDITELPSEISKLKCLKCLDLSGNRLRMLPEEIGDVRSIKYLILDDNELTELPLRLGELRSLRYLSVCDNKLRWLPQRPVFNYHHCEFRFWRNAELRAVPYSMWYHMLRDQQTRSLNIGCLKVPYYQNLLEYGHCRLKFQQESRIWEVDIACPPHYSNILERSRHHQPPSLYELCKRRFYGIISGTAKSMSDKSSISLSIYSDNKSNFYEFNEKIDIGINNDPNNNMTNLHEDFKGFEISDEANNNIDMNGNSTVMQTDRRKIKAHYVPADVIEEYFNFLPRYMKMEFCRGPVSKCENVKCKKPVFDFVTYEFCIGKIVLIDNMEDVILSAAFCSQNCANVWKGGKTNVIITWKLTPPVKY